VLNIVGKNVFLFNSMELVLIIAIEIAGFCGGDLIVVFLLGYLYAHDYSLVLFQNFS
jgi:hypothetical protein